MCLSNIVCAVESVVLVHEFCIRECVWPDQVMHTQEALTGLGQQGLQYVCFGLFCNRFGAPAPTHVTCVAASIIHPSWEQLDCFQRRG